MKIIPIYLILPSKPSSILALTIEHGILPLEILYDFIDGLLGFDSPGDEDGGGATLQILIVKY